MPICGQQLPILMLLGGYFSGNKKIQTLQDWQIFILKPLAIQK